MNYEHLWAPWRLGYILGDDQSPKPTSSEGLLPGADPECFLCQGGVEGDDRQRLVVARGERTLTVLNRYPYNNGHLLVAPQRHLADLAELDEATQLEIATTTTRMVGVLKKLINPDGFNVGLNLGRPAGAGLPGHLHWHIVPRWNGDTNFMPALAAVRVVPQSLEAMWELLAEELAAK